TLEELVSDFDISKISHATPKFDINELKAINSKILHMTSYDSVKDRIHFSSVSDKELEQFWSIIRANINSLNEISMWLNIVFGDIEHTDIDKDYIKTAASLLPTKKWDENTWSKWTNDIKAKTGKKGKELFMPLRLAVTGQEHGPEMKQMLLLIGEKKVRERLI
ncbi:MAG: glutamate--tRNA ligase, partial [Alphaproteobacteria bacterium]|nr:glutamate--tRNA ligase [Alphaproteobacteria bacterium]